MYKLKNCFVENFLHDNAFLRGHNMPTWATTGFPFWGAMQEWHVQKFDQIAWQSWPAGFRRCDGSRTWHKLWRTSSFDPQTTLTVQRGSKCVKIDQIWNRTFQLKKSKNHRCSYAQALFLDSLVRTKVPACKRVGGGVGCPLGWRYRGQFCPNFGFYRSDRKNDKNLQKNS